MEVPMRSMADKSTTNLVGLRSPEFNSSLECLDVQKKGSVVGNESFLTSGKVQILSSASITSDFQGQCDDHSLGSTGILFAFENCRNLLFESLGQNKRIAKWILSSLLLGVYAGYLAYVLWLNFSRAQSLLWCSVAVLLLAFYFRFLKTLVAGPAGLAWRLLAPRIVPHKKWIQLGVGAAFFVGVAVFLGFDVASDPGRLRALVGIALFIVLGIIFSHAPGAINWRIITSGIATQFILGLLVLRWTTGKLVFEWIGTFLQNVLSYAHVGSAFVFSPGEDNHAMAFKVMPVLLFASFLIAILYHIGAMSWFVEKIGWFIYVCLGTTAAESVSAAANVFLGMTEAPLTIKPYIDQLTVSEFMAVMSGGFATISGSLMVTYASMGVSAENLLAASVMNAPAALVMAKLLYPERQKSSTTFKEMTRDKGTAHNVLDAAMMAATGAVQAIASILAMLICATAFLALFDGLLGFLGGLADLPKLTLAMISSYIFYPLAYLMGVDPAECQTVGELLGLKTFVNEFVAYAELKKITTANPLILSAKGNTIATYALCGFCNFGSVGIQLANFSMMAPNRKKEITSLVLLALFAGFSANILTASIAGLLITENDSLAIRFNGNTTTNLG